MKNGVIVAILLVIWGAIKAFFKLLKAVVHVLSALIVFFGLYIPLFYLLFGIILLVTTDFTFGGTGVDQILYFVGLGVCCVAAAIIGIRNALIRPIASVFEPFREYAEERRRRKAERAGIEYREEGRDRGDYRDYYDEDGYPRDRYEDRDRPRRATSSNGGREYPYREPYPYRAPSDARDPYGYYAPPREYPPQSAYDRRSGYEDYRPAPERPLIYYSQRRPGVLVKEYSDRFELFREEADGRRYIGTEYKDE